MIFVFFFILLASDQCYSQSMCSEIATCSTCMNTSQCVWCTETLKCEFSANTDCLVAATCPVTCDQIQSCSQCAASVGVCKYCDNACYDSTYTCGGSVVPTSGCCSTYRTCDSCVMEPMNSCQWWYVVNLLTMFLVLELLCFVPLWVLVVIVVSR